MVPKFHYFLHIALRTKEWSLNPRWQHTYVDESMMGRFAKVYKATSNGPYKDTIQRVALIRYFCALHIMLGI